MFQNNEFFLFLFKISSPVKNECLKAGICLGESRCIDKVVGYTCQCIGADHMYRDDHGCGKKTI